MAELTIFETLAPLFLQEIPPSQEVAEIAERLATSPSMPPYPANPSLNPGVLRPEGAPLSLSPPPMRNSDAMPGVHVKRDKSVWSVCIDALFLLFPRLVKKILAGTSINSGMPIGSFMVKLRPR